MRGLVRGFVGLSAVLALSSMATAGEEICRRLELSSAKDGQVTHSGALVILSGEHHAYDQQMFRYRNELRGIVSETGIATMVNQLVKEQTLGLTAVFEGATAQADGSVSLFGEVRHSWMHGDQALSFEVLRQPVVLKPGEPKVWSMAMPDGVRSVSVQVSDKMDSCSG